MEIRGPYSSELSSLARYSTLGFNTYQFFINNQSCWDQFASSINYVITQQKQRVHLSTINCDILTPYQRQLQHQLMVGFDYLPGPNDENYYANAGNGQYDVGSLVDFHTSGVTGTGSKTERYHFEAPAAPPPYLLKWGAKVRLKSFSLDRWIKEGQSDSLGNFLVIGSHSGDLVSAVGPLVVGRPPRWLTLDSNLVVNRAFSKQNEPLSSDSVIEVPMRYATGAYAFLPLCSWQSNGDLDLGLADAVPFLSVPTVTFSQPGSTDTSESLTYDNTTNNYSIRQSSLPISSSMIVNATDSSGYPLPIALDYSMTDSTLELESDNGMVQVTLDSLNSATVQRFACVSSEDYPCPMDGLPSDAENMGSIQAISFFPPGVALQGNNTLHITYSGSVVSHPQSDIQIFKWDAASYKWVQQTGGIVDSSIMQKAVSVAIHSDGIYGVFATSVVAGVESNTLTNSDGIVAFYNANTKTIRVNFEAASDERASLEIYNILGVSVKSLPERSFVPGPQQLSVPAQELPSGIYFCTLKSQTGIKTAKIVIAR